LADYQGRANGGEGWLRILEFSPSNNVVRVKTFSPTLDRYETDADSEFTVDYDMRRGDAFGEVGQITGVNSGNHASLAWTNLIPGATYEWYAEVSDGLRTMTSPICLLTIDPSASLQLADRHRDTDGDGLIDAEEVLAGTDWADLNSVLRIESLSVVEGRVELRWSSVEGITYRVCGKRAVNGSSWTDLSDDILGEGETTGWSAVLDDAVGQQFFAVRVVTDVQSD